jgi:Zn-dependent protease
MLKRFWSCAQRNKATTFSTASTQAIEKVRVMQMGSGDIIDKLLFYLGLIVLLTFHEFAHAWVAYKCGDDTARLQGRMSINPIVHIDPLGTVLLPLLMLFGPPSLGRFLIGFAKPVPVNLHNLNHPVRDDCLIALAGPAMNLVLGLVLVGIARITVMFGFYDATDLFLNMAQLSLLLCFFNLIPVPPLDGSHVLRNFIGMSWETYIQLCRFGFIAVIIVINIPGVRNALASVTNGTRGLFEYWFHFP